MGGGGGAISAAALPNGRAPGNAMRSARHLGSNIVQSVSEVVESVGLFVCRETLLHWRLTGCGKCNMRLHPDYERVAVGVIAAINQINTQRREMCCSLLKKKQQHSVR